MTLNLTEADAATNLLYYLAGGTKPYGVAIASDQAHEAATSLLAAAEKRYGCRTQVDVDQLRAVLEEIAVTPTPADREQSRESPERRDGEIRAVTCYLIDCSDCGEDCWTDYTVHFSSPEELRQILTKSFDWTFEEHGRALCEHCTKRADCARDGHQHGEWITHAGVQWRYCDHCGGACEERFNEMAEGGA